MKNTCDWFFRSCWGYNECRRANCVNSPKKMFHLTHHEEATFSVFQTLINCIHCMWQLVCFFNSIYSVDVNWKSVSKIVLLRHWKYLLTQVCFSSSFTLSSYKMNYSYCTHNAQKRTNGSPNDDFVPCEIRPFVALKRCNWRTMLS